MKNFAKLTSIKIMIFGFARIYLCKRLAKSELKLANWKLGFQFSQMNLHCNMNNDSVIDKVEIVQFFLEIIQELFVIM